MKDLYNRYLEEEFKLLKDLDIHQIAATTKTLTDAYNNKKQIIVMGNGGSAATANHFVSDLAKNAVRTEGKRRFKILSLAESNAKITALGNDINFDEIFSQQLMNLMEEEDVLIAISASGSSPDLIRACEYAKTKKAKIISLSGFSGGKLKEYSDVLIATPSQCYEQVEDIHMLLTHVFVTYFKENENLLIDN